MSKSRAKTLPGPAIKIDFHSPYRFRVQKRILVSDKEFFRQANRKAVHFAPLCLLFAI